MNPNDETVRLSIDATDVEKGAKRANSAIQSVERAADKADSAMVRVTQRSANSIRQITARAERIAAGFGKSGADRDLWWIEKQIKAHQGEEKAVNSLRKSYDELLRKRAITASSSQQMYSVGQNVSAPKDFARALAQVNRAAAEAKPQVDSFFSSFLKAQIVVDLLEAVGSKILHVGTAMVKYAAGTQLFQVAARAVAEANGEWASTADRLMATMQRMGITTRDSARAVSQSITGGMGTGKLTQLARMAQDVAVMAPESTSSDVLTRMLYAIQSAQPEMLRTVGVNVNFEKAYSTFARANQRTVESLTENEKAQIRLANVLERGRRWAGLYEESLGYVGKQIQQLDRHGKEAANAIGQKLLPALSAIVNAAIGVAQFAAKNPGAAVTGLTVTGAAATGAAIGGLAGGPKGALIGAGGAGFGALMLSQVLSSLDRTTQAFRAFMMTEDRGGVPGRDNTLGGRRGSVRIPIGPAVSNAYRKMGGMSDAVEASQAALQARMEADEAKRKPFEQEQERILQEIAALRNRQLEGLAKINAEHAEQLRQLRVEKRDTAELIALAGLLRNEKEKALKADNERLRKEQDAKWAREANDWASEMMTSRADADIAQMDRIFEAERDLRDRRVELRRAGMESAIDALRRQEQLALAVMESQDAYSLTQKQGIEQQKLAIHLDYIAKFQEAELKKLEFERGIAKQRMKIELSLKQWEQRDIDAYLSTIDDEYNAAAAAMKASYSDQADLAKKTAIRNQAQDYQQAWTRAVEATRNAGERLFDALITKTESWGDAIKNILKSAVLSPLRQIAGQLTAMLFAPMTFGMQQSTGAGAMSGRGYGSMGGFNPLASLGTSSLGMAGMIGPGGTAPFVGGGGGFGNFRGMGTNLLGSLSQLGNIGMGGSGLPSSVAMLNPFYKAPAGVGGVAGGAMLAGGGTLAALGLQRGGWSGMGMTAAGGALIGFKFGGPMGALIGGAIGAGVGLFRMLFGGAEKKAREKIKSYYGVDVADKGFLKQIIAMAKQTYGGNLDVAIRSRDVRDMIELYAMSTGQRMSALDNVARGVSLSQSGGSIYQTGSYSNGVGYSYGGAIQAAAGLSAFAAASKAAPIVLDKEGTKEFWSDVMATGIVENPRAVQKASNAATRQNYGRTGAAINLTDPLGVTI